MKLELEDSSQKILENRQENEDLSTLRPEAARIERIIQNLD